jgi:LacI family transcriptional regulator
MVVNRRLPNGGPSTSLDDERGMRVAVQHLIDLGHTRIGYIGGPHVTDISRRRLAGYRQAMRAAGLRVAARCVKESSGHESGGFEAMSALLETDQPPTAVAVWSVTTAVGALAAVRRSGRAAPDDISVIAFHDASIAQYLEPPLATVRMPTAKMAKVAVESVIALADGRPVADTIVSRPAPVLVRRASTGRPPERRSARSSRA